MKKAYSRLGSVFTIFLLAVFCLALLPPTTVADDVFDVTDLLTEEARDTSDEHPWNGAAEEPSDGGGGIGACAMYLRISLLALDYGIIDVGGNAQTLPGIVDCNERKGVYETQDLNPIK